MRAASAYFGIQDVPSAKPSRPNILVISDLRIRVGMILFISLSVNSICPIIFQAIQEGAFSKSSLAF